MNNFKKSWWTKPFRDKFYILLKWSTTLWLCIWVWRHMLNQKILEMYLVHWHKDGILYIHPVIISCNWKFPHSFKSIYNFLASMKTFRTISGISQLVEISVTDDAKVRRAASFSNFNSSFIIFHFHEQQKYEEHHKIKNNELMKKEKNYLQFQLQHLLNWADCSLRIFVNRRETKLRR